MKAPEYEEDGDQGGSGWSAEYMKHSYHRKELRDFVLTVLIKLLKEAGMIPGSFDTDDLFDLDLAVIQTTSRDLFGKLKVLVGEVRQIADPVSSPQIDVVDNLTVSSH
ncbi:hypothetical protein PHMEG_0009230 [Phytophthora megakarya]|uniref:Uncharacterized protein n=1 Tax=Phytophthora megakarya TaxID=4795 RepID=A0A225WI35_9STRA|nr:hypothetical protein PHMEG_0009230 [Phytophthora megakarya]